MHRQGRVKASRKAFQIGRKWTARTVVRETRKAELKQQIVDRYGAAAGSREMFRYYQPALTELIKGLTEDEMAEAEETAKEWNSMGGPGEAQAR